MHSRIVLFCTAIGAVLALSGCGGEESGDGEIVAAFYPLAYAAEQVAVPGDEVVDLTRAGQEPHDLELSPRDVARVHEARLVVYAGRGFQPGVQDAVRRRSGPSLDALDNAHLSPDAHDPHVWLDPTRYGAIVYAIAVALDRPDAARPMLRRLEALDAQFAQGLRRCQRRTIVTSHAAFGYLADRYGLRQLALVGLTPEAEPGPGAVSRLAGEVRAAGATTVFTEPLVSPALAETVAREAGASTAELDPLEALTPSQEASGADYFSVMRDNLRALRDALGCT